MHDSIETYKSSVCHTTNMTCLSVCQSNPQSACHTTNMTRPYVCQSRQPSDHRTVDTKGPSVCQPHEPPVRHTTTTTCPSVCQPHHTSVRHAMNTNSPSVCQPHDTSVRHTNITRSPSVCPSKQSSDRHTTSKTSPSLCQSRTPSVCHNVIPTSPSICQLQDSSVCNPTRDARHAVCSSSVTSVLPSANPTVKIPTGIPYRNPFPYYHGAGNFPFAHTSTESSVHHPDSPFVNSSPFAAYPSILPGNYGENSMVNYLHENPVKSPTVSTSYDTSVVAPIRATYVPFIRALYVRPVRTSCVTSDVATVCASSEQPVRTSCVTSDVATVCASSEQPVRTSCVTSDVAPVRASSIQPVRTSCVTSVVAPVCALSIPSVHPYDDERWEFPDGFPGTHYGEKNPSKFTAKIPHDVTLTLQQAKFPDETPDTTKRVEYPGNFMLTQIRVKFTVINLRNYVLGGFHVASRTMRCAHGSINMILMEWDPGPTYDVQRLWDPGGPTYSSRSSVPTNLDKLGKPKSYLDYIHLPGLSPLPFLVTIKPNLASSTNLEKLL